MHVPSTGRRRRHAAIAAFAAFAALVHCSVSVRAKRPAEGPSRALASGLDDDGYLALAGRLQSRLDRLWNPRLGRYAPGPGSATTEVNADLLIVHSIAEAVDGLAHAYLARDALGLDAGTVARIRDEIHRVPDQVRRADRRGDPMSRLRRLTATPRDCADEAAGNVRRSAGFYRRAPRRADIGSAHCGSGSRTKRSGIAWRR